MADDFKFGDYIEIHGGVQLKSGELMSTEDLHLFMNRLVDFAEGHGYDITAIYDLKDAEDDELYQKIKQLSEGDN